MPKAMPRPTLEQALATMTELRDLMPPAPDEKELSLASIVRSISSRSTDEFVVLRLLTDDSEMIDLLLPPMVAGYLSDKLSDVVRGTNLAPDL